MKNQNVDNLQIWKHISRVQPNLSIWVTLWLYESFCAGRNRHLEILVKSAFVKVRKSTPKTGRLNFRHLQKCRLNFRHLQKSRLNFRQMKMDLFEVQNGAFSVLNFQPYLLIKFEIDFQLSDAMIHTPRFLVKSN